MKREYTWWLKCAYKVKTGLMWPSMHEWGLHFLSIQIAQRMVHTLYWMCIQWLASCLIAQRTIPFHICSILSDIFPYWMGSAKRTIHSVPHWIHIEWCAGPTLFHIEWGAGKPLMSVVFSYIDDTPIPSLRPPSRPSDWGASPMAEPKSASP